MPGKFKSLKDIIGSENDFRKIREITKEQEIVDKFAEIFPELSKIAAAKKFDKGKLFLRVENSVWRSELNFKQSLLIDKINKAIGEEAVKTIKFL